MSSLVKKVTHASKRSLYRFVVATLSVLLATGSFWYNQQHAAAIRFTNRSLSIYTASASEITTYEISFMYPTTNAVGSVRMLFCQEAIPYLPCDPPSGIDVSGAVLSAQNGGDTGFTVLSQTQNSIIMTRPPVVTDIAQSTYTFTNMVNPDAPQVFYIRLNSFASTDATGSFIDFGSVASAITTDIGLRTQVPPYLVFCTGKEIPLDCTDPKGPSYEEFEDPSAEEAMSTSSEMLAYTNARGGYVVVMTGRSLTSGIYEIPAITNTPEESLPGKGQFGVNLTENTEPAIGSDPVGPALNYAINPDYTIPDKFMFDNGDIMITSSGVTKRKKYTVSYVINVPPDQHPGIYNTTVSFICTGNF